jgi:hypothetical protein
MIETSSNVKKILLLDTLVRTGGGRRTNDYTWAGKTRQKVFTKPSARGMSATGDVHVV